MVCTKKNLFRTNGPFCARKWHILITLGQHKEFFSNFAEWKGLIGIWKIYCFSWKKFIWGNLIFSALRPFFAVWSSMVEIEPCHCYYRILKSQDVITFMVPAGSLNSQDMIRILKQSRHDFSGKHLWTFIWQHLK